MIIERLIINKIMSYKEEKGRQFLMQNSIISEGKTTNEAIENGLKN